MIRYSFYFLLYYITVAGQANAISKIDVANHKK